MLLRHFDLHVYVANWGSRQLLIRLPTSTLSEEDLAPSRLDESGLLEERKTPQAWLVGISVEEIEDSAAWDEFDDGSGWMGALAGLRQELLAGDLRFFYLCWLWRVQEGEVGAVLQRRLQREVAAAHRLAGTAG
ncbi:MAG: hypothetical protein ACQEXO_17130 [Pseudomonadota bacterium]